MTQKDISFGEIYYKRISKSKARKQFDAGSELLMIRNKANPYFFAPLYVIVSKGTNNDFDKTVNAYEYYNNEPELGNRTEFYIREDRMVLR